MHRIKTPQIWIVGVALLLSLMALPAMASAQIYDVTLTNLTKGQIFSEPVVYTHRSSFDLFTPGESAIPELAGLAEDAAFEPLIALLGAEPKVAKTQDCDHIPGPPCGNGGVRVTEGAEGYVYVHAGIQDRGSLSPENHDWRNPVARIVVRKVTQ
jgi:hypothetical protein